MDLMVILDLQVHKDIQVWLDQLVPKVLKGKQFTDLLENTDGMDCLEFQLILEKEVNLVLLVQKVILVSLGDQ